MLALRSLAHRVRQLDRDVRELKRRLGELLRQAAPRLLAEPGVGPESAAKLLIIAGDTQSGYEVTAPSRPFAAPARSKPQPVKTAATASTAAATAKENALWTIANNRMLHPETRACVTRRASDGLSRKETRLMRHLARRLYLLLLADLADANQVDLT